MTQLKVTTNAVRAEIQEGMYSAIGMTADSPALLVTELSIDQLALHQCC